MEVWGTTGRRLPIPHSGSGGTRARPKGASPSPLLMPHSTLLFGHAETHFPGPVGPSPGLTPGLFFLSAPPRPLPVQQGRNPSPVSTVSTPPPPHLHPHPGGGHLLIPEAKTWGSCPSGWGSLPHNWDSLAYCKPKDMAAQLLSSHTTSFLPFGKRCTSFFPFGNLIERERDHRNMTFKRLKSPQSFLNIISWWRKPVFS